MSIFGDAIDDLFADPNLTQQAVWRAGGSGVPVTAPIILHRPDRTASFGETRIWTATVALDVRTADAPLLAEGDEFEIDGDTFVVQGEPLRDAERLIWTAEVIRA
ncbi:MAG: hypothetical protein ACK4NA_07320 [Alphaproteobacteria bacterium]